MSTDKFNVKEYVKEKLDKAADWRAQEWEKLEARKQRIQDLNNMLLDLRDQARGD